MCDWRQKDDFECPDQSLLSYSFDNYSLFLSLNLELGQQTCVNPPARLAPDSVKEPFLAHLPSAFWNFFLKELLSFESLEF